jgi:hypothetical protein
VISRLFNSVKLPLLFLITVNRRGVYRLLIHPPPIFAIDNLIVQQKRGGLVMIVLHVLLILIFILVTWALWENRFGNKRYVKKMTAIEKRDRELIRTRTKKGKRKQRLEQADIAVGAATAIAGAALLHNHREDKQQTKEPIDPYKEDLGLYDDSLDNLYDMDRVESLEYFGDVQSYDYTDNYDSGSCYDHADYDDFIASMDDDY